MKKTTLIFVLLIFSSSIVLQAQQFLRPFETIASKKTTYITMEDGSEIEGKVRRLKYKRGLIKEINIKNDAGKKEVPIEDINFAYLPQSAWDKIAKATDFIYDATQWDEGMYDQDRIKEGYAFFEKSKVMVKKKERILLMQLLNPGTCSRIKVYHNPFAGETASVGVAGVKLAGGNDKSYYIRIDNGVAFRLRKKNYKKQFSEIFGDCPAIRKKFGKARWSELEEVVFEYNKSCKE